MTAPAPAQRYAVRVAGHLDDHWVEYWTAHLGAWNLRRDPDGTTTLSAEAADQAQLYGLLAGLRDIGAVLLDVHAPGGGPPHR